MISSKNTISNDGQPMLSARKVAARLKCAPDYVSKLCREGKLKGEQVGGQWFVIPSSIEEFEATRISGKEQRSAQLAEQRRNEQVTFQIQHGTLIERIVLRAKKISVGAPIGIALGASLLFGALVFASSMHVPQQNQYAALSQAQSPFFGTQAPAITLPTNTGKAFAGATSFLSNVFATLFGGQTKVAQITPEATQKTDSPESGKSIAKDFPTSGAVAPSYIPGKSVSAPSVVNNYPVVERIVERTVATGGVNEAYVTGRLEDLYNRLAVQISNLQNPGRESPLQNFAVSQVINNLSDVRLNGDTNADNIFADLVHTGRLDVTGDMNVSGAFNAAGGVFTNLTVNGNATTTGNSIVLGDLSTQGGIFGSSTLTILGDTTLANATSTNFFSTTASSTNLFAQSGSIGTLSAQTLNLSGLASFLNGFTSLASSTIGDGTQTGGLTINGGATTTGNTALQGTLAVLGNTTLANATSSAFFATTASSTNLFASTAQFGNLSVLGATTQTGLATFTNGFLSNASSTITSGLFSITGGFLSSASSTINSTLAVTDLSTFFTGLLSLASTTIGDGTATGGLTINGGATTTGNAYIAGGLGVGIATSAPGVLQVANNAYFGGNLFVGGDSVVIGNSTSNTIAINSAVNSNIVPNGNKIYDLGSPSFFWRNAYLDNLTVNSISAASTSIGGTVSNSFTVNSDNATADTEDMQLIFFRGTVVPNAVIAWNAAPTAKRFEFNQSTFFSNQSGSTTQPTLALQGIAGQTGNIFQISSSTGSTVFAVASDGSVTIATTSIVSLTSGTTTLSNLSVTNLSTSTFAGGLSVSGGTALSSWFDVGGLSRFFTGLLSLASTTIGDGTATGGLTISGGATTTGNALFQGIARISDSASPTTGTLYFGDANANLNYNSSDFTLTGGNLFTSAGRITSVGLNETVGIGVRYVSGDGTYYMGATHGASPDLVFTNNALEERARLTDAGNFGIGTTSPFAKLSVAGNGYFDGNITATNITATSTFNVLGLSTFAGLISTASSTIGDGTQIGGLTINGGATTTGNAYFASNVGIGTTSPAAALYIANQTSNAVLTLDRENGKIASFSAGSQAAAIKIDNTGRFDIRTATRADIIANNDGTSIFTVSGAGNVGVGTTTPSTNFAVQGDALISGTLTAGNLVATSTFTSTGLATFLNGILATASSTIGNGTQTGGLTINGGATTTGNAYFAGNVNIATTSTGFALATAGAPVYFNVGNNPAGIILQRSNVGAANTAINFKTTGGDWYTGIGSDLNYYFNTSANLTSTGAQLTITTAGNIGIGTTSPWAKLSVEGTSTLGNQAIAGYFTATSTTVSSFAGGFTAFASTTIGNGTQAGGLTISGGATTTGTAYFAGNVGVGNVAPSYKLDITSGSTASQLHFASSGDSGGYLTSASASNFFMSGGASWNGTNWIAKSSTAGILGTQNGAINFYNNSGLTAGNTFSQTETLRISNTGGLSLGSAYVGINPGAGSAIISGSVGIGTTSPWAKLSVEGISSLGNQAIAGYFTATSTTASSFAGGITSSATTTSTYFVASESGFVGAPAFTFSGDTNTGIYRPSSKAIGFSANGAERVRIDTGGLAVGTTTTAFAGITVADAGGATGGMQLDFSTATSFGRFDFSEGSVSKSFIQQVGSSHATANRQGNLEIGTLSGNSGAFAVFTNGSERLRVDSTGNIGIGTTSPWAKLSVEGTSTLGNQAIAGYFTATSTTASTFAGGLTAFASTTIGNGTQTGGLTISGGATTTGTAYFAGNVGIGTTSPSSLLSLQGSGAYVNIQDTRNSDAWSVGDILAGIDFRSSDSSGSGNVGRPRAAINAIQETTAGSQTGLSFVTGGINPTEKVRITNSGLVGIGTTTPIAFLDVGTFNTSNANIRTGSLEIQPYALNNAFIGENVYYDGSKFAYRRTGAAGLLSFSGTEGGFRWATSGSAGANAGMATYQLKTALDGTFAVGPSVSGGAGLYTGATFLVTGAGNVGIGTTSPWAKLSVEGTSTLGNQAIAGYFTATSTTVSSFAGGFLSLASSTIGNGTLGLTVNGPATTTGSSYIAGKLGVGSTTSQSGTKLYVYNGSSGGAIAPSNADTVLIEDSVTPGLTFLGPDAHIQRVSFSTPSRQSGAIISYDYTNTLFSVGTNLTGGGLAFNTGANGERMRITSSGNVGIGTTSPAVALSVAGDGYFTGGLGVGMVNTIDGTVNLASITGSNGGYRLYNGSTLAGAMRLSNAGYGVLDLNDTSGNTVIELHTNGSSYFNGGSVGIGTTTPWAALSVEGTSTLGNQAIAGYFTATSTTASSTFMGGVGIGTASPTNPLTVVAGASGTESVPVFIQNTSTTNGAAVALAFGVTNTPGTVTAKISNYRVSANDRGLAFSTYNGTSLNEAMRITGYGYVGIGTTTPWAALSVEGSSSLGNQAVAGYFTATSTTASSFAGGFLSLASSTIGNGTLGLTVNGAATTTGNAYFAGNVGIGTSTPQAPLQVWGTSAIFGSRNSLGTANAFSILAASSTLTDTAGGDLTLGASGGYGTGGSGNIIFTTGSAQTSTIVLDATSTASGSPNTVTWSHTVGSCPNNDGILIIAAADSKAGVKTVSSLLSGPMTALHGGTGGGIHVYYVLNPVAGADTLSFGSTGSTNQTALSGITYCGVNQTNPFGTKVNSSGTGTSAGATTQGGQILLDFLYKGNADTATVNAGQTLVARRLAGTVTLDVSSAPNSNPTMGMTWTTSSTYGYVEVPLLSRNATTGSSLAERLRINADGKVGIGTTTPWGSLSITNSTITTPGFVVADSSNIPQFLVSGLGNVGIGTTSPFAKLSVAGDAYIGGNLTATGTLSVAGLTSFASTTIGNGTATGGLTVSGNATTTGNTYLGGLVTMAAATPGSILFASTGGVISQDNSNLFYDSTNHRIGLGTTNPQALLHLNAATVLGTSVGATATTTIQQWNTGNSVYLDTFSYRHTAGSNWAGMNVRIQKTVDVTKQGFIDFGINGRASDSGLGFGSGTNTYMVVGSNGNVGLGTTSPTYKLSVEGTSSLGNQAIAGYFTATSTTASTFAGKVGIGTTSPFGTVSIVQSSVAATNPGLVVQGFANNQAPVFQVIGGNSPNTDLFSVIANTGSSLLNVGTTGNVGISSSTASAKLTVTNITATPSFIVEDSASDTTPFIVDTSGNVGIGTATPGAALSFGSGLTEKIRLFDSGTAATSYGFGIAANDFQTILGASSGAFTWRQGGYSGTERMRLTGAGNLGIGTTTPWAALSVEGTSSLGNQAIAGYFTATSTTATSTFAGGLTVGTNGLTVFPNGFIGIGTTTPVGKLHVSSGWSGQAVPNGNMSTLVLEGSADAGLSILTPNNRTAHIAFGDPQNAISGRITYAHSVDAMGLYTAGSERLTITSAGNVGIGTTTPGALLDVFSSANSSLRISSNSGASSLDFLVDYDNNGTTESGMVRYFTGSLTAAAATGFSKSLNGYGIDMGASVLSAPEFFVSAAGNVGIGTTTPQSKLSVVSGTDGTLNFPSGNWAAQIYNQDDAATSGGLVVGNRWYANTSTIFEAGSLYGTGSAWQSFFTVKGNGNVGIGTTTPLAKLNVQNSSDSSSIALVSGATKGVRIGASSIGGIIEGVDYSGTGSYQPLFVGGSYVSLANSNTEVVRVTGGSVGIGTTTPYGQLSINPNGITGPAFVIGSSTATLLSVSNIGVVTIKGNGTGYVQIGDNGQSGGSALALNGTAVTGANYNLYSSVSDTNLYINRPLTKDMLFRENNATQMILKGTTGALGIGTTTPYGILSVYGDGGSQGPVFNPSIIANVAAEYGSTIGGVSVASVARNAIGQQIDSVSSSGNGYAAIGQLITRVTAPGNGAAYGLLVDTVSNTSGAQAVNVIGGYFANITANSNGNANGLSIGAVTYSGSNASSYASGLQIANSITNTNTAANAYAINSLSTAKSYFAGSIGIGTTTPQQKLHITSTGTGTTLGQLNTNLRFETQTGTVGAGNEISFSGIGSQSGSGVYAAISAPVTGNSTTGAVGYLSFSTKATSAASTLTEAVRIDGNGLVGIGTTTPVSTLTVTGSACFSVGDGATVACGTTPGNIYYSAANTANYDVAERYATEDASLAAGDVVALDPQNPLYIEKAKAGSKTFGVISSNPGLILGGADAMAASTTRAVALSGRVPVKVNLEGGDIAVGDSIVLSSQDGVATKATSATYRIGVALQPWNAQMATSSTSGVIEVFIKSDLFVSDMALDTISSIGTTTGQMLVASTTSPVINGLSSTLNSVISSLGSMVVRTFNGAISATVGIFNKVYAKEVHTDELCLSDSNGETCITKAQLDSLISGAAASSTGGNDSNNGGGEEGGNDNGNATSTDTIAPTITLLGNNPATISVGVSYSDLGATISDNIDSNLGFKVSLDGGELMDISALSIDTATSTTYTILFSATDSAGNTGTATRTVIVE